LYTLTLDHPLGQLTQQWGLDYPPCVKISSDINAKLPISRSIRRRKWLFSGLKPREAFNAYFYLIHDYDGARRGDQSSVSRMAERQITADDEGTALVEVQLARSFPGEIGSIFVIFVGMDGKLYSDDKSAIGIQDKEQLLKDIPAEYADLNIQPKYDTYYIGYTPRDWYLGETGQVAPKSNVNLTLYSTYSEISSEAGKVPVGDPILILEQKIGNVNNHVVVWSHVQMENGTEGWTYNNEFLSLAPLNKPGSKIQIQQLGTANGKPISVMLRKAPKPEAESIATLNPGNVVTFVANIDLKPGEWGWLYVQDQNGHTGYIPTAIDYMTGMPAQPSSPTILSYKYLPWAAADVSKIAPPVPH
jgi:hypothetical protein